jgi:hypothetical protein
MMKRRELFLTFHAAAAAAAAAATSTILISHSCHISPPAASSISSQSLITLSFKQVSRQRIYIHCLLSGRGCCRTVRLLTDRGQSSLAKAAAIEQTA